MEKQKPTDRLNYSGELDPVIKSVCQSYGIGSLNGFSVIEIGYEDCNVAIETSQGKYFAKMFSKTRKPDEVDRYATIMQKVVEAGVNHPELMVTTTGERVMKNKGIALVLMHFIEGKTFFEMNRTPDNQERLAILEQAAKVNRIQYKPPYIFDSWAIPNIKTLFDRVKQYIKPEELAQVLQVISRYDQIPVAELPQCFVHGDFTKANLLKGNDGTVYILDFSVANWYPRIQELAVIAANLLHVDNDHFSLKERCGLVATEYSQFNQLTDAEKKHLHDYTLAGVAMEFLGAHQERYINGNDTEETEYWLNLGREGLKAALV